MPLIVMFVLLTFASANLRAQWTYLSTIDIEVIADTSPDRARAIIDRVLEARVLFPDPVPLPVRVFVLTKGPWFARLRPAPGTTAFASTDRLGTNVMVLSSATDRRTLLHEYTHLVIEQTAVLPAWLDEGLAEFHSTTELRGRRLVVGLPIPEHVSLLQREGLPPLAELLAVRERLPGPLYPAAWALAHLLRQAPGYRDRFPTFWNAIRQGVEARAALESAFGRPLQRIESDLAQYVRQPIWPSSEVPTTKDIAAVTSVTERACSQEEFEEEYAGLLRKAGLAGEATRLLAGYQSDPRAARRAQAALAQGKLAEARRAYEQAIAEPGAQGDTWYEYATLLRDLDAAPADVEAALDQALTRSPRLRDARLLRASLASRRGDFALAAGHLEAAAHAAPRQFDAWYELAFAWRSAGEREKSLTAARRALQAARTPQARERAEALLAPLAAAPPANTITPRAWKPSAGDSRVEGRWTALICGTPAKFQIEPTAGERLELLVDDPRQVSIAGANGGSLEMKCGAQSPARRIQAGYDRQSRQLRALEFLD